MDSSGRLTGYSEVRVIWITVREELATTRSEGSFVYAGFLHPAYEVGILFLARPKCAVLRLLMTNHPRAAVGISDYPSTSQQRHIKDSLAPLEGILGACRQDG